MPHATDIEIVAEIANAHQGDPAQAALLAERALAQGADAVKFQVYFADELLVRAHPRYEHFRQQAFSEDEYDALIRRFATAGARVYCDVFGERALRVAEAAGAHGFKIHSTDIANDPLVTAVGATGRRALLSTGGTTAPEIARALGLLLRAPASAARPMLLHGYQAFPTAVEDSALRRLGWLRDEFGGMADVGYMDHVEGSSPFATILPAMAIAAGARMIEKHVTLRREDKGVDWYSSINVDDLGAFIGTMRLAARAVNGEGFFSPSEKTYRARFKKHWVARAPLRKGAVLRQEDLVMKQVPESAGDPVPLARLVGRPLLRDLAEEEEVLRKDVAATVWACVVARSRSSRLPGKALLEIAGKPALLHLLDRLKRARLIDRIVLCTTVEPEDDQIAALAERAGVGLHRGPTDDVLARIVQAFEGSPVDIVLRVTGDDILVDPFYADKAIRQHIERNAAYTDAKQLPSGTEVEVFDADLLRGLHLAGRDTGGTEYLTTYITDNADHFPCQSLEVPPEHALDWRLTLDTPEDLAVIAPLIEEMTAAGKGDKYSLDDLRAFYEARPELLEKNRTVRGRGTPPEVETRMIWSRITGDVIGEPRS